MSRRARILLIGYRKFSELINAVLPDYEDEAEVVIVESVASGSVDYPALVRQHRPDVVASAGSNAAYLEKTLKLPVIAQPVTDADIVDAVARARAIGERIHVFTYAKQPELSERVFQALAQLGDQILSHLTYSTTNEAAEQLLAVAAGRETDVVVAPSYVCHLAEQRGIPSVLIYSKDSARRMLEEALRAARSRGSESTPEPGRLVVQSESMERVLRMAHTYARGSAAVLIEGESGTGKEHIAREIHRCSDYSAGPLVAINCGSIPNELFESELFGYVDGAFTGSRRGGRVGLIEQANGGVLYLDEIGEMPPPQQAKLLRVLQERRVRPVGATRELSLDFKVIAATNADLAAQVASGAFRDDLFYRLNVFCLRVPPLRARSGDIAAIAQHYLECYGESYGVDVDVDALLARLREAFEAYRWPGNVRELQNFSERLVVNLAQDLSEEELSVADVLPELYAAAASPITNAGLLKEQECRAIHEAMQRLGGDKTAVSRELGISTTTLWRRLKEMNGSRSAEAGAYENNKRKHIS
ncbi:MAG: sigma 54-interacting transcriptional regulator [Pseudomonadota bacterium]